MDHVDSAQAAWLKVGEHDKACGSDAADAREPVLIDSTLMSAVEQPADSTADDLI